MKTTHNNISLKNQIIIGDIAKPYFIAEIGTNHNSDIAIAKKLIQKAYDSGFDCVKFQIYEAFEIVSPLVKCADYKLDHIYGDISAQEMFDKYLKTPKKWFPELINFSKNLGIQTCATLHGKNGIDWAKSLDFDLIKIASMDHNNIPLFEYLIDNTTKPILISFGLALEEDILKAINTLEKHKYGLGVFHCVSVYPPNQSELRLSNIKYLKEKYKLQVGFSDHTVDYSVALTALSLGATFFEKHITLDKKMNGPDHAFALIPQEMELYINFLTSFHNQLRNHEYQKPSQREDKNRVAYMKSAFAKFDLKPGQILDDDMISFVRQKWYTSNRI